MHRVGPTNELVIQWRAPCVLTVALAFAACVSPSNHVGTTQRATVWPGSWPAADTATFAAQLDVAMEHAASAYDQPSDAPAGRVFRGALFIWATALFLSEPMLPKDVRYTQWIQVLFRELPLERLTALEGLPETVTEQLVALQTGLCDDSSLVDLYVRTAHALTGVASTDAIALRRLAEEVDLAYPGLNVVWIARALADDTSPRRETNDALFPETSSATDALTMDQDVLTRSIAFTVRAHDTQAKTDLNRSRRFDGMTPFSVHSLWCGATLITDPSLSVLDRRRYFRVLFFHDIFEDTTIQSKEDLPADLTEDEERLIRTLTFAETLTGPEKTRLISDGGGAPAFNKLYDAVANVLDWCPKPGVDAAQAQSKWTEKLERMTQLVPTVETAAMRANVVPNILRIARALSKVTTLPPRAQCARL